MTNEKQIGKAQPEALATFAAASRNGGKKPEDVSITASAETMPIPGNSRDNDDAANKVLRENVLGTDQGADEAIDKLPDRTKIKN
jgi:hypothetical protein